MKPDEFGMVSTETLDGDNVFFVDNVISSGATIRAARDAVGGGKGLVYAKSNPKGEKYAIGTADPELPKWLGDKIKKAGAARLDGASVLSSMVRVLLDKASRRKVDRYVAVSEAVAQALVADGVDSSQIVVVPNGVDVARLTEAAQGPLPVELRPVYASASSGGCVR